MIKQLVLGLGLCAMSGVLLAAPKPCAELQAEIINALHSCPSRPEQAPSACPKGDHRDPRVRHYRPSHARMACHVQGNRDTPGHSRVSLRNPRVAEYFPIQV